jgi:hypothetical protein
MALLALGSGPGRAAASIRRGAAGADFFFPYFFIYLWSGSCQNGSAEVAQVAPMGAHAAVRMPGGLAYPCRGVGVPKYR